MTDSPRIQELRRRVQADPASIAFAQLAEECRRAGANDDAVQICLNGLATHPGYLSARVTLGRALIELGHLDDANRELNIVVQSAPDNMAAIRGLAEICQQQGRLKEALAHYKHALTLASHDADLEHTVDRISQAIAPAPPPKAPDVPAVAVEELFDFDKLLAELGEPASREAPASLSPAFSETPLVLPDVLRPADGGDLVSDDSDDLASMERELRAFEEQRAADEQRHREAEELRHREAEELRLREAEELRLREAEELQLREAEELQLREAEEVRLREAEELRLREAEELRLREAEEQRLREDEEQLLRELEEQRLKDEEEERQRALEAKRLRDEEEQLFRELDEQRLKDEAEERERASALEAARLREQEEQLLKDLEEARLKEEEAARLEAERLQQEFEAKRARAAEEARRLVIRRRHQAVLNGLEGWLGAIIADRDHHDSL